MARTPKKQRQPGFPGIEPHTMAVPQMDRPSVMFAMLLDAMVIEKMDQSEEHMVLACAACGESVCEIEEADSLRVLLNTALAHKCYD